MRRNEVSPEVFRSSSRIICPVTVVPTFAPIIIPSDWCSVRIPAATRPEVITMVAVEDWISAVTAIPRINAFTGLSVTFSMTCFSVPEEFSFRESPIRRMPYRNIASPPSRDKTSKKFIFFPSLSLMHKGFPENPKTAFIIPKLPTNVKNKNTP